MLQKMHESDKFLTKIAFRALENFERLQEKTMENVTNAHSKAKLF